MRYQEKCYIFFIMKLTEQEVKAARKRREAYEHSMAIEGLHLHPDDKKVIETIEQERMGYDEGVQYMIDHFKKLGIIPPNP